MNFDVLTFKIGYWNVFSCRVNNRNSHRAVSTESNPDTVNDVEIIRMLVSQISPITKVRGDQLESDLCSYIPGIPVALTFVGES